MKKQIYLVFSLFLKPKYDKPITISMFLGALRSPMPSPSQGCLDPDPGPAISKPSPATPSWAAQGPGQGWAWSRQPWLGEGGGDLKAPKNIEIVMGLSYFDCKNNETTK